MTPRPLSLVPWLTLLSLPAAIGLAGQAMAQEEEATAVFAGGCFWCVEQAFDKVEGVVDTTAGFSGGHVEDPNYKEVTKGDTGHAESVKVEYDPDVVDYEKLLHVYWRNIDPFVEDRQFCDEGEPYRTVIFTMNDEQRSLAEADKEALAERFDREIETQIVDFEAFYPADEFHQNYYQRNPARYNFYKSACGRVDRLEEIWGEEAGGV